MSSRGPASRSTRTRRCRQGSQRGAGAHRNKAARGRHLFINRGSATGRDEPNGISLPTRPASEKGTPRSPMSSAGPGIPSGEDAGWALGLWNTDIKEGTTSRNSYTRRLQEADRLKDPSILSRNRRSKHQRTPMRPA
jgi:hypothetical protein